MDVEEQNFVNFLEKATKNKLDFIIIGGLAILLNGIARHTQDVDIWIEPSEKSKHRFLQTLLDIGYTESEIDDLKQLDFSEPQVFTIEGNLDILTQVHRLLDFKKCYERAREHILQNGISFKVLHINDLRESKVLARRPQDYRDIILIDDFLKQEKNNND